MDESSLVVIVFNDDHQAGDALASLRRLEKSGAIEFQDTAVLSKDADGKLHVNVDYGLSVTIRPSASGYTVTGPGISDPTCGGAAGVSGIVVRGDVGHQGVTLSLAGGTLPPVDVGLGVGGDSMTIRGTGAGDQLTVDAGSVSLGSGGPVTFAGVERIGLAGLAGADHLSGPSSPVPLRLLGGGGNDTLGGSALNDFLDGGPGTDACTGGGGTDTIQNCE